MLDLYQKVRKAKIYTIEEILESEPKKHETHRKTCRYVLSLKSEM